MKGAGVALLSLTLWLLMPTTVLGHAMDSAQWQLVQRDSERWDSRLRLPERADGGLMALTPTWPADCERLDEAASQPADEGVVLRWQLRCPQGLSAGVSLDGFSLTLPDAVLQVVPLQGPVTHAVLSRQQPRWQPTMTPTPPPAAHYLALGVHHILLGPDHLLFVLGLWALWRRSGAGLSRLVATVTAFTLAHSITLVGATLAGWRLPGGAVEACIAASILLLAVELASDHRGAAQRWPAVVAFAFGLLHGFGFAGALADTDLPPDARGWALAAFNVGIEAGQLAFVLGLTVLARWATPAPRLVPLALLAYGGIAAYWFIDRSAAVLHG